MLTKNCRQKLVRRVSNNERNQVGQAYLRCMCGFQSERQMSGKRLLKDHALKINLTGIEIVLTFILGTATCHGD